MISVFSFFKHISERLNKQEEELYNAEYRNRISRVENVVYPKAHVFGLHFYEYFIYFVVLISIIEAFAGPGSSDLVFEFFAELSIFTIFAFDFLLRIAAKGRLYLRTDFAKIDIGILSFELFLLVFLIGLLRAPDLFSGIKDSVAVGFTVTFVRLVRVLRLAKLLFSATFIRQIRLLLYSIRPFIRPIITSVLISICALFLAGLFFSGSGIVGAINLLKVFFSVSFNGSENLENFTKITDVPGMILGLIIMGIIAQIFVPQLREILERQRKNQNPSPYTGHTILCLADPQMSGLVEELCEVFAAASAQEVLVMIPKELENHNEFGSIKNANIRYVDIGDRKSWFFCGSDKVEKVVILGSHSDLSEAFLVGACSQESNRNFRPEVYLYLGKYDELYRSRPIQVFDKSLRVVYIDYKSASDKISDLCWSKRHLAGPLFRKYLKILDDECVFPTFNNAISPYPNPKNVKELEKRLKAVIVCYAEVAFIREKSEDEPFTADYILQNIDDVKKHLQQNIVIIFEVSDLSLFKWNSFLSVWFDKKVYFYARQLSTAFAVHHEVEQHQGFELWVSSSEFRNALIDPQHLAKEFLVSNKTFAGYKSADQVKRHLSDNLACEAADIFPIGVLRSELNDEEDLIKSLEIYSPAGEYINEVSLGDRLIYAKYGKLQ